MLHHIQRSIIDKLGQSDSLRYGELKPAELDGNVFGYHLKQSVTSGMVTKHADGRYSLSSSGREYFIHRYENPLGSAHPILLMMVRCGESYLLRKRRVQPFIDRVGFVHGEPLADESVEQTARRRFREKTGLAVEFDVKATALISQYQNDELTSYSLAIVLYGETDDLMTIQEDATGQNLLSTNLDNPGILPSCRDLVELIERGQKWAELIYHL